MAQTLAVSTVMECPGSRGFMCRRRRCALKLSTRFSRTVAAVKYVRVTDNEMSGPLCTQCGVPEVYLGLLGNQAQRPVTHSLSTVAVFAAAAAASRRHRAVLAGVTTGLVLHFARDVAEGYPGCGSSGRFRTLPGWSAPGGSWE
jgi:hypothetical protein